MMKTLKIATRQSPLAMWQAEHIRDRLEQLHAHVKVELVTFVTQGDKILDTPLAKIGGKGLFVKELEVAMLEGHADIAVRQRVRSCFNGWSCRSSRSFHERCADAITRRFGACGHL